MCYQYTGDTEQCLASVPQRTAGSQPHPQGNSRRVTCNSVCISNFSKTIAKIANSDRDDVILLGEKTFTIGAFLPTCTGGGVSEYQRCRLKESTGKRDCEHALQIAENSGPRWLIICAA